MFSQGVIPSGAQQSRGTPLKNSSFCDGILQFRSAALHSAQNDRMIMCR